jgi:hypothetical protein
MSKGDWEDPEGGLFGLDAVALDLTNVINQTESQERRAKGIKGPAQALGLDEERQRESNIPPQEEQRGTQGSPGPAVLR